MLLRPDFTFYLKGIRVRRYDLTQHNPNAIPMPTAVMDRDSIVGITILPKAALFTHTYWLNCRDGVIGSREELNTRPHPYKMCPSYILPHWDAFEERVWAYYDQMLATIAAA